jgi:TonB family protein
MTDVNTLAASVLICAALAVSTAAMAAAPAPAQNAPPAAAAPATTSTPAERLKVYREFRAQFDAGKFADALAPAEELVAMTEAATGPTDPSLATPLINLATAQYQLSDYASAEASYLRAIRLIEQSSGGYSHPLLAALRGLGLTYLAAGQPQAAVAPLRRGVDIVRKIDGLFGEAQLEILDPLVRAYGQLDQDADAEREAIYSYRVSENHFGKDKVEVVPALEKLAHWYSGAGRYTTARQYFGRALGILQKNLPATDARLIAPLRGIADAFRLEYIYGPEISTDSQAQSTGGNTLAATMGTSAPTPEYNPATAKLDPAGGNALRAALAIAEAAKPAVDPALHADMLIDLGDWRLLNADKQAALDSYRLALPLLQDLPVPQNAALATPAQILYRRPAAAYRSQRAKPENIVEGFVEVEFTVTAEGRVTGEYTVEKSASDTQEHAVLNAIRKARYRPRFEQGEPVETRAVRFRETVFSVKSGGANKN